MRFKGYLFITMEHYLCGKKGKIPFLKLKKQKAKEFLSFIKNYI
jgi:hypothetical protein